MDKLARRTSQNLADADTRADRTVSATEDLDEIFDSSLEKAIKIKTVQIPEAGAAALFSKNVAFQPFGCDPIFRYFRKRFERRGWLFVAVTWAFVVILLVLVNLIQGTFSSDGVVHLVKRDIAASFGRLEADTESVSTSFVLLRDVWSLVIVAAMWAHLSLLFIQWHLIEELIPKLSTSNKVLYFREPDRSLSRWRGRRSIRRFELLRKAATAVQSVEAVNERWRKASRLGIYWIAGVVIALLLVSAEMRSGVFWYLAPKNPVGPSVSEWSLLSYEGWWASFRAPYLGIAAYFLLATVIFRYVVAQNHVGLEIAWFFFRWRKQLEYRHDAVNRDDRYGWWPLAHLLWTVYPSVTLNMIALGALLRQFGPPFGGNQITTTLWYVLLSTVGLGLLYIFLPCVYLVPRLRKHKCDLIEANVAKLASGEISEEECRVQNDKIRMRPTFPIRLKSIFAVFAFYITPPLTILQFFVP